MKVSEFLSLKIIAQELRICPSKTLEDGKDISAALRCQRTLSLGAVSGVDLFSDIMLISLENSVRYMMVHSGNKTGMLMYALPKFDFNMVMNSEIESLETSATGDLLLFCSDIKCVRRHRIAT